jgi:hypothetical protein
VQRVDEVVPAKRRASCEHLEQDGANREQIGAGVQPLGRELLRSHVAGRPHEHAASREVLVRIERADQSRIGGSRQTEVEQLHTVRSEKHVRRLQVPVNDPACMQRRQCGEHRQCNGRGLGYGQGSSEQSRAQSFALQQLHGDEQLAAIFANLVELADVGVVDARRGARFTPESPAGHFIIGERRHHLHSDSALESLVTGCVHHSHPALSQLAVDRVMPDSSGRFGPRRGAGERWREIGIRRQRSRRPVVQGTEPSPRRIIESIFRHSLTTGGVKVKRATR